MGRVRKEVPLPPLEERFTYAFSGVSNYQQCKEFGSESLLYFLFNATLDIDTAKRMIQNAVFDEFLPGPRYGTQLDNGYAITNDINIMTPGFGDGEEQTVLCFQNGQVDLLDPQAVVDACQLPQRHILGCGDCLEEEGHPEVSYCKIKHLYALRPKRLHRATVTDLRDWRHLSKTIEGFKFISPACVQDKMHFTGRIVGIDHVNFEAPEEHREARQEVAQTQARLREFRNNVCSQCFIAAHCGSNGQGCSGTYDKTEDEYSEDIIKRAVNPYTDDEFWYLFDNAGMLDKRYKRKRSYVTFRYRDGLEFVLGNLYEPQRDSRPLSFKQAKEIIEKYRFDPEPTNGIPRRRPERTAKLKALLIAVASLTHSPPGRADKYFYRNRLPVRFIAPSDYNCLVLDQYCFTHPKNERRELTVRFEAKSLLDIYKKYRNIPFVRSTSVKSETDSWRWSRWRDDIDVV